MNLAAIAKKVISTGPTPRGLGIKLECGHTVFLGNDGDRVEDRYVCPTCSPVLPRPDVGRGYGSGIVAYHALHDLNEGIADKVVERSKSSPPDVGSDSTPWNRGRP